MSIEELSRNPWLAELSSEARQKLLDSALFRRLVANQQLHRKASPADGLYGVVSGEVRISATTLSGGEIVFTRIQPGDWFGEIALLDGGERTHDAYTTTETIIAVLPKQSVLRICKKYPEVHSALVTLLCTHCREAFDAIDDFLLFTPAQRIARRILQRLKVSKGNQVPLKQEELGALIGISRQSTNKILKTWEAHGWIKRGYGRLIILDENKLRETLID